ncbi:hypothetical protein Q31b_38270 [Novipirellula aureliae]|uniref:ABC transmembrane type-1 domain-containing protein n=1 Tax=Novipirellula aureliae TaxID=2527966 RepID=A0A5C6DVC5_9BACT|nr:hypothetical protein [Novipirellula aureliae]TWU38749.1 hypothetical protein Q31b_38270 [Novipirellula aureliae]
MNFWFPLLSTLQLIAVVTTVSLLIGIPSAWAAETMACGRMVAKYASRLFILAMTVALAIPLILHAAIWESTAGKFGWLSLTGSGARSFEAFHGLVASGWIHAMVGSAIVTLATWCGTQSQSRAVIENSLLDASPLRAWWTIRLPLAWPWVLAATLINAGIAGTEMTVVDLYGYRTLADEFYLFYAANPNGLSIAIVCALPLCLALGLGTLLLVLHQPSGASLSAQEPIRVCEEQPSNWSIGISSFILLVSASLIVLVPIVGLFVKIGHDVAIVEGQIVSVWSIHRGVKEWLLAPRTFASEYQWTIVLGLATGLLSSLIAWPMAALGRRRAGIEKIFDVLSICLFCIPGPVVAIAVVNFFQFDVPIFRFLYEMTIVPTVIALSFRATSIAYWVLRSGYRGISDRVFEASALEMSSTKRFWRIDRPLIQGSLVTAIFVSAVFASGDVPVTLPVVPPGISTVGTRLFGLLHSGARYQEAALAIWHLMFVVSIAAVIAVGHRHWRARMSV